MRTAAIIGLWAATALVRPGHAQGYIRWPTNTPSNPQTVQAWLIQSDVPTTFGESYDLYFPGFTTIASSTDGGEKQGTAVDTPTEVRHVSGVEFVEESSGMTLTEAPLFVFSNPLQTATLPSTAGTWTGFFADVTGEIPEFKPGVLAFRLQSNSGFATLRSRLVGARALVTETNAMGVPINPQTRWMVTATDVQPARVLYYKFDRGAGDIAFNYGGFPGAPSTGSLVTNEAGSPWTSSQFGGALRGGDLQGGKYTFCDTGWDGGLYGSFSVAWMMRQRTNPPGAQVSPVFTGPNGFRCYTGGPAGSGLRCEGWGGTADLPVDIQTLAAAGGWVHVALVIDGSRAPAEARWYVNGTRRQTTVLASDAAIPAQGPPFVIGGDTLGTPSAYDIDEFRLWAQPVGDEVMQSSWSKRPMPAATSLGTACSANLRHLGSPARGSSLDLVLEGLSNRPGVLFIGGSQIAAPLDLGTIFPNLQNQGCLLYGGIALSVPVATNQNGLATLTIPIPATVTPVTLYSQGMIRDTNRMTVSNAHAASIR